MLIASIAAYILKQGVRHMSTQFKKQKTKKQLTKKAQCLKFYLWHEITSLLGNNLSITSCEPMSVQFHIETRLSLSHPVFPPHKIVPMETLISRLQKPVDDIIVATSTFNLSTDGTKDGHTLIL